MMPTTRHEPTNIHRLNAACAVLRGDTATVQIASHIYAHGVIERIDYPSATVRDGERIYRGRLV